jgi:hypothetical protein
VRFAEEGFLNRNSANRNRAPKIGTACRLEQYANRLNHTGSIDLDAIALHFKKLEHLFPIDWIAKAIPINRKML